MAAHERLKAARLAAGLTQEQLAAKVGGSKQSVCNAERGTHALSLEWLYEAAVAIGVRPSDLDDRLTSRKGRGTGRRPATPAR